MTTETLNQKCAVLAVHLLSHSMRDIEWSFDKLTDAEREIVGNADNLMDLAVWATNVLMDASDRRVKEIQALRQA